MLPLKPKPVPMTSNQILIPLGTPTSKELLSAGVSDDLSCDIPWDDNMGDELLKVLIDKARLFEAQIWYVIKASLNSLASCVTSIHAFIVISVLNNCFIHCTPCREIDRLLSIMSDD